MQSIISETNQLWGSSFLQSIQSFLKISELEKKIDKDFFDLEIIAFELVALNTCFYWERIHVIGCQDLNTQSQNFRYYQDRIFGADFLSKLSINLTKLFSCWFKLCFGSFNMLTVHKCFDTRLFRHLSKRTFCCL